MQINFERATTKEDRLACDCLTDPEIWSPHSLSDKRVCRACPPLRSSQKLVAVISSKNTLSQCSRSLTYSRNRFGFYCVSSDVTSVIRDPTCCYSQHWIDRKKSVSADWAWHTLPVQIWVQRQNRVQPQSCIHTLILYLTQSKEGEWINSTWLLHKSCF